MLMLKDNFESGYVLLKYIIKKQEIYHGIRINTWGWTYKWRQMDSRQNGYALLEVTLAATN